jgi:hypothetical protein
MRYVRVIVLLSLLFGLVAPALAGGAPDSVPARSMKISRWVSNLSGGAVLGRRIGLVKSFWWYAIPNIFALGLSFDFVGPFIPLSVNVAVQAPLAVVTPFICGGAGGGITGHGITGYGGGLRVRLGPKFGLVAEYRRYHYTEKSHMAPYDDEKIAADYLGAGISWRY